MKEIDRESCRDCKFFRYVGGTDRYGYIPNKTGDGICTNPDLPLVTAINRSMTPRQALEAYSQTNQIKGMEADGSTCFKYAGLTFPEEALAAFYPTSEDREDWLREDGIDV